MCVYVSPEKLWSRSPSLSRDIRWQRKLPQRQSRHWAGVWYRWAGVATVQAVDLNASATAITSYSLYGAV